MTHYINKIPLVRSSVESLVVYIDGCIVTFTTMLYDLKAEINAISAKVSTSLAEHESGKHNAHKIFFGSVTIEFVCNN